MTKRVFMTAVIISLLLSIPAYAFAAVDSQPAIVLDGIKIETAANIGGEDVYLPLRAVGEALGYEIQWFEEDKTISVTRPGKNIVIDLKNGQITADDHGYYLSRGYKIIADMAYLGTDFFSDNFGLKVQWDRQNGIIQLDDIQENAISIKTIREASENDKIKTTLQYPQVDGLDDYTVQDSINTLFIKSALDARDEGLENVDEYTGSPNKCETYFDYRLKYNQNGLLSVAFLNYQYFGGAHGLTVQRSHTFNLKTGEEYKLKDLFKSDADYVSFISNNVRNEIDERVKEGILSDYSIAPFQAIRDDQDFNLSNNGVVVYFQQYEHWPYAAGIQEFTVEFSVLKDMLKPEFSFLNDNK